MKKLLSILLLGLLGLLSPFSIAVAEEQETEISIKLRIELTEGSDETTLETMVKNMRFANSGEESFSISNMIPIPDTVYTFQANTGIPVLIVSKKDQNGETKINRTTFNNEVLNLFSVDENGIIFLKEGKIESRDTSITTPELEVSGDDAHFKLRVDEVGRELMEVTKGKLNAKEKAGNRTSTIEPNTLIAYSQEAGFVEVASEEEAMAIEVDMEKFEPSEESVTVGGTVDEVQANKTWQFVIILVVLGIVTVGVLKKMKK